MTLYPSILTVEEHHNGNFTCIYNINEGIVKWTINNDTAESIADLPDNHREEVVESGRILIIEDVSVMQNWSTYSCEQLSLLDIIKSNLGILYVGKDYLHRIIVIKQSVFYNS